MKTAPDTVYACTDEDENTILIVDDEENIINSLKRLLRRDGYNILTAIGGNAGLDVLKSNKVAVIISDQRMPEMSGVEFLGHVKELYPDTVRIVLSGYTDLNSVTDAINKGSIYKFLTKPWEDDLLRLNIQDAFKHYRIYKENKRLSAELQRLNKKLEERVDQQNRHSEIKLRMLQLAQDIMDSQPVGVIGIAEDDTIAMANNKAHEILSIPSGTLLGAAASHLLPEEICTRYAELGKDDEIDVCFQIKDSEYRMIARYFNNIHSAKGIVITLLESKSSL
ncbi:MAG: response regulator [Gammaproteobacteria bacterium]|nr:response regulator [Gammaproteobacteria bacterium]